MAVKHGGEVQIIVGEDHRGPLTLLVVHFSGARDVATQLTREVGSNQFFAVSLFPLWPRVFIEYYFRLTLHHVLIRLVQCVQVLNLNVFLTPAIKCLELLLGLLLYHLSELKIKL